MACSWKSSIHTRTSLTWLAARRGVVGWMLGVIVSSLYALHPCLPPPPAKCFSLVTIRIDLQLLPRRPFQCTANRSLDDSFWLNDGSSWCHILGRTGSCVLLTTGSPHLGHKTTVEDRWRDFFSNPSEWWDARLEKVNPRHPDFKHKNSPGELWINSKANPPWVATELSEMAPGTLQSSISSWNIRLARHVKAGKPKKAMGLFQQMQQEGMTPDRYTFTAVLNACTSLQALEEGRRIHTQIIKRFYESDMYVGTSLVDMYAKCGSIEDAQRVFSKMPMRNTVSWSVMILGYVKCGQGEKALELYRQMKQEGVELNPSTFLGVLNACASVEALEEGRGVHKQIIQRGLESDVFMGSCLVDMYAKCGCMEDAWSVFNKMPSRNVVTWSAMIRGLVKSGQSQQAVELFQQMQQEGVEPGPFTFVAFLNACASVAALEEGRRVHKQIIQRGFESNTFVGNSLIDMYSKCGSMEDAWRVFNKIPSHDVIGWTSMIQGYVKCGEGHKALDLSQRMRLEGVEPNRVTLVGMLNACASLTATEEGRDIHKQIIQRGLESDIFVGNSLIDMYAKCGSIEDAWRVFNKMPTRNVVSWNALILGYVKVGKGQRALQLYRQMQQEGVEPSPVTFVGVLNACASIAELEEGRCIHEQIIRKGFESDAMVSNSLVNMYTKCDSVGDALKVFSTMPTRDVVAWTAMILGYVKCGQGQKALELSKRMQQERVEPNPMTFVGMLNACASMAALEEGKRVHEQIIKRGYESDLFVGNCLIDMYSKCGSIGDAQKVFKKMPTKDVVSWNTLLAGFSMHGCAKEALEHFKRMCEARVEINRVTFISLLSACSHGGLVDEGLHLFNSMTSVFNISPTVEHYSCQVDLLGRAGRLHDAEDVIRTMSCEPSAGLLMSLLGACRVHGNVKLGERVAKELFKLDPGNASAYVLLMNIYAAAGKWDSSAKVRQQRLERGVEKKPGRTWIEVNNEVHSFTVDDQDHPQITEIHAELTRLSSQIKEAGYLPDIRFVLHDLEDEEKMLRLCHHSEKLAIAFGLINTPPGTPIRIFKNLRVCGDCHTATKFISKLYGKDIIVRDANRFHHFKDGLCSCGDYW